MKEENKEQFERLVVTQAAPHSLLGKFLRFTWPDLIRPEAAPLRPGVGPACSPSTGLLRCVLAQEHLFHAFPLPGVSAYGKKRTLGLHTHL